MHDDDDSFTARYPDGRLVRLRVKRDIDDQPVRRPGCSFLDCLDEVLKADAADDGGNDAGDRGDQNNTSLADHPVALIGRLLVASGGQPDLASAVHYLLNTSSGAALLRRTSTLKAAKDDPQMQDNLAKIAEDIGVVAVAKAIVSEQRNYGIDESAFVALVTEHAKRLHPNLTEAAAFSKIYESEPSVWQACAVLHAAPFVADLTPLAVGGIGAQNEANDATERSEANRQLAELGQQRWPNERPDVQFSRAFELRPDLAAKAHRRPSATTSYEFPR
jgi:hypothetical protein